MMGSFLTRGLVMMLGYAYPAYECFKTVEKNKPEIEQLRFWCQYWILVAVLTVLERVGDTFISWLPMYSEAKLAFIIYLWYPRTRGTTYVYDAFLRPYVAKHENEIDRNLMELRTRAGDMIVLYWQKAASYGQTRMFEILQYVASQSASRPRPSQKMQSRVRPPPPAPPSTCAPVSVETPEPSPNTVTQSTIAEQQKMTQNASEQLVPSVSQGSSQALEVLSAQPQLAVQSTQPGSGTQIPVEMARAADTNVDPLPEETLLEESIRVTRARLRKNRALLSRS